MYPKKTPLINLILYQCLQYIMPISIYYSGSMMKNGPKRFSSSCELYEDLDLTCTLVWLATKPVINPDNIIRESIVSCQNELMVNSWVK